MLWITLHSSFSPEPGFRYFSDGPDISALASVRKKPSFILIAVVVSLKTFKHRSSNAFCEVFLGFCKTQCYCIGTVKFVAFGFKKWNQRFENMETD